MERLNMLINNTEEALQNVSMGARGLYLTLHLLAQKRNGVEIIDGKPLALGKEPTPEVLHTLFDETVSIAQYKSYYKELKEAKLVSQNPIRLLTFYADNEPILRIVQSNSDRKGMRYSPENQMNPTSLSGAEEIREDKSSNSFSAKFRAKYIECWPYRANVTLTYKVETGAVEAEGKIGAKKLFALMDESAKEGTGWWKVYQQAMGKWKQYKPKVSRDTVCTEGEVV